MLFTRSNQISSPLLLPLLGSILTTGVLASIFLLPPLKPTLSVQQLLFRAALDLSIAACVHVVTVWAIWHIIREYLEPTAGTLAIHIWAAVAWIPLIVTLDAERSLWISCIVPWFFANALVFLNLWSTIPPTEEAEVPETPLLFLLPPTPPLWRTLLPYCITIVTTQLGIALWTSRRPWAAAALFSAGLLLFAIRHPFASSTLKNRRRFSRSSILQTAAVFFLISTALTPFLQRAYGLRSLAVLLATTPKPIAPAGKMATRGIDYSGVILTLPAKPHPRIVPPAPSQRTDLSTALAKPVVIPFDGAYWYFKLPDTRPKPDARIQHGDPMKANVRSTDNYPLAMEAHQVLPNPIAAACCRALRVDLLNGDDRPGAIRLEMLLKDTSGKSPRTLSLGSLPIKSSQLAHIPLNRPAVAESLRFPIPAAAHGKRFDEITIVIRPAADRARAGSKISIQSFVLVP